MRRPRDSRRLYGLDDRIPPHFLKPHEPQRNEALGSGDIPDTRAGVAGCAADYRAVGVETLLDERYAPITKEIGGWA